MNGKHTPGPDPGVTLTVAPCKSCAALGGAHFLHCRTLRLAPGWYDRSLQDNTER